MIAAALCLLGGPPAAAQPPGPAKPAPVSAADWNSIKPFLDKAGGYRDRRGGYYNPAAGTYTDEVGGVVDNWSGYTYADGSYKSAFGDYFDSKKGEVQFSSGGSQKLPAGMTNAEIIALMRENVAENGGFDKDFMRRGTIEVIRSEHPAGAGRR